METSPLLARRAISRKERLQKALTVLLLTALIVAGAWLLSGASADSDIAHLILIGTVALAGLCLSAYLWFKTQEEARTKEASRSIRRRIDDERQGRGWPTRLWYNTKRLLAGIVVIGGILIAMTGLGILGLQLFGYLKTGEWRSISTLSIVSLYVPWIRDPGSWFGLNDIVRSLLGLLPLSLAFVVIGWLIAGLGSAVRQRISR